MLWNIIFPKHLPPKPIQRIHQPIIFLRILRCDAETVRIEAAEIASIADEQLVLAEKVLLQFRCGTAETAGEEIAAPAGHYRIAIQLGDAYLQLFRSAHGIGSAETGMHSSVTENVFAGGNGHAVHRPRHFHRAQLGYELRAA